MNYKSWNKNVVNFCPGIGKGKLYNNNLVKKYFSEPVFSDYLYRYYYHVLIKIKKVNYRLLSHTVD